MTLTKDDIKLSGNEMDADCIKTSPGGTGTIEGTVTVDGVRAKIEFLTVTGPGEGVRIGNRADARLTCNDISNNAESGVTVWRSSNAVLVDNTLSENGQRSFEEPDIFFDCGLYVLDASSVRSDGNTYEDNQYCAISSSRHAAFRNGTFLPREPGHPADPDERDVYTEKGCFPGSGVGCFTNDSAPIAIELFNNGLVDLRNFEINGAVRAAVGSSFRLDADGTMRGNMFNEIGSFARIRNRKATLGDRQVTFKGTLTCDGSSQTYFSSVQCGQTCDGIIAGDTAENTCTPTP